MGFSIGQVTSAVEGGLHDVAEGIAHGMEQTGHVEARLARSIVNRARQIGNQLPGGMKIGDRVIGRGKRTPKMPWSPSDKQAPHPGDFPILTRDGKAQCGDLKQWGGGQPFTLVGFKALAAGAQTQGTDIVDFHAAASNPVVITSDDKIPGNIEVFEASLYISARLTTTLGFEGPGFFNQLYLVEYVNGIEKARWSIKQLAAMIGGAGIITSGGAAFSQSLDLPSIPWRRKYDPNVAAKTALQLAVTTTTVSILDCAFVENGVRP